MKPYPYNAPLEEQLQHLQESLDILKNFGTLYPDVKPLIVYGAIPAMSFPSSSIQEVRDAFGPEGWTIEGSVIRKEVYGVSVEAHLPQHQKQPFTL